jgi:Zn-dependent protease with chaperone function
VTDTLQLREFTCPTCTARARLDPRFVQWCTECGYGVDPRSASLRQSPRERRRAEREEQRALRLYASLRTATDLRPRSALGSTVTALSALVHLSSLALLVLPILLVAAVHGAVWSYVVLAFAWLTFAAVRPRFFADRLNPRTGVDREKAPLFYALLDRCAAELDCQVPAHVSFNNQFNASTGRAGLRRTSFLRLGMPLWAVLSGGERLALLGHELAHQVNGDPTHGAWAGAAQRTIFEWTRLLNPRRSRRERVADIRTMHYGHGIGGALGAALAPILMAVVFAPFFLLALGARLALRRLDLYCGQRAEYLADELGARLAGSEAAHGMLAELALGEPITADLLATRNRHRNLARTRTAYDASGLWASAAGYAQSIPETERQRRRTVDRMHNLRADRSHPATHLRLALIAERPQLPGALGVTDEEWAAVDAELAPAYLAAARAFLG